MHVSASEVDFEEIFGLLRFQANDSDDDLVKGSFNGEIVTFQCSLPPSDFAFFVGDLDEEPSWLYSEVLDGFDFGH